jgi:hypothetical protein
MASRSVERVEGAGSASLLFSCIADHGSAAHPYFRSDALQAGPDAARNLADAVHFLCTLHGRHPGVVDLAALRAFDPAARAWLAEAAEAMAAERAYLTRLAVAAGAAPSTPGGASSDTAVISQRSALVTLAQSDRAGCALGAALALAVDWSPIRTLLDSAALRLGVETPPSGLGDEAELRLVADVSGESPSLERALLFGAQQLARQHFGLWDLLEARYLARRDS